MYKKIFHLSLSTIASVSLIACGGDSSESRTSPPTSVLELPAFCNDSTRSTAPTDGGVATRWDERADGWARALNNKEEIMDVFSYVEEEDPFRSDPGSWTYELRAAACEHEAAAIAFQQAGDDINALTEIRKANKFYDIARFPFLATPEREAIYQRMLTVYEHLNVLAKNPIIEKTSFNYEGHNVEGYFQKPVGIENPALIILTGGLDTWKTSYSSYLERFWEAGFATFVFDMPGTGLNTLMLDTDGDKVYSAAIEHFKNRSDINGEKIAAFTISFSGVIGIELALTDTNVAAVVTNCGGSHEFYINPPGDPLSGFLGGGWDSSENIVPKSLPLDLSQPENQQLNAIYTHHAAELWPMQQAILWTLGFRKNMHDPAYNTEAQTVWSTQFPALSLVNQGVFPVAEGTQEAPFMQIHSGNDALITETDFYDIPGQGVERIELFFPEDSHCAPRNFDILVESATQFLVDKMDYAPTRS